MTVTWSEVFASPWYMALYLTGLVAGSVIYRRSVAAVRRVAARRRDTEMSVLAAWIDQHHGTPDQPAPGTVALYTLWPFHRWSNRLRRRPVACPFPVDHVLHVVSCVDNWPTARGGFEFGYRWAATCTRCGAHWTELDDETPPPHILDRVRAELATMRQPNVDELLRRPGRRRRSGPRARS